MKKSLQSLIRGGYFCLAWFSMMCALPQRAQATTEITSTETSTFTQDITISAETGVGVRIDKGDTTLVTSTANTSKVFLLYKLSADAQTSLPEGALTIIDNNGKNNMAVSGTSVGLYAFNSSSNEYKLISSIGKIKAISFTYKNGTAGKTTASFTVSGTNYTSSTSYTPSDEESQAVTISNLSEDTLTITTIGGSEAKEPIIFPYFVVTIERTTLGHAFTIDPTTGTCLPSSGSDYSSCWERTATDDYDQKLILTASANNMQANSGSLDLYTGSKFSSAYNIYVSSDKDYTIAGYYLAFKNKSGATEADTITLTDGTSYTVTDEEQVIFVEGLTLPCASFTLTGPNTGSTFTKIVAYVTLSSTADNAQTYLFKTDYESPTSSECYRIPAIANTKSGALIAVCDRRAGSADVGAGQTSLVYRFSTDNGSTWSDEAYIYKGTGTATSYDMSFGDAALVADRESDKVLLMCAFGCVSISASTYTAPIRVARKYATYDSTAKTLTWDTDSTDMTATIYGLFNKGNDSRTDSVKALFFSSGRIFQSSVVKTDSYYRLYAALYCKEATSGTVNNYVLYSDDFGETWKVLGGAAAIACESGNESKCEELPDGSVIISSRVSGGRYFNVFTYAGTDGVANGTGSWGTRGNATDATTGPKDGSSNGTDGEILILPAKRNSDESVCYVALQSIPKGSGRSNVAIYYKELKSLSDLADGSNLATDWDGSYQVSTIGSAYSTMCVQSNDSIAFFYEEDTYALDYTNVYKQLGLNLITSGAYSYYKDITAAERKSFIRSILEERKAASTTGYAAAEALLGTSVGQYTKNRTLDDVLTDYDADDIVPSAQDYADILVSLAAISTKSNYTLNMPQAKTFLRIKATKESQSAQPYLTSSNSTTKSTRAAFSTDGTDATTIFYYDGESLLAYSTGYYLTVNFDAQSKAFAYYNGITSGVGVSTGKGTSSSTATTVAFAAAQVDTLSAYNVIFNGGRYLYTQTSNSTYYTDAGTNPSLDGYNFNLEEVTALPVTITAALYATLYAPVALTIPTGVAAYTGIVNGDVLELTKLETTIPANTPVVLKADAAGTYDFTVTTTTDEEESTSLSGNTVTTTTDEEESTSFSGNIATNPTVDNAYTLQYIESTIGFYPYTGSELAGFKSYLVTTLGVRGFSFNERATSINAVQTDSDNASAVYDLSGRRVNKPTSGLYIIGGKKVIFK